MKIPAYIRYKMHRVAKLHSEANDIMHDIETWFEKNGVSIDYLRCTVGGNGFSLEELDYGLDVTDRLCEFLESEY